jgi:xeroderma pigmentosum group C-complementing protein
MAGTRGRLRKATDSVALRRSTRRGKASQQDEGVPAVFQEMLRDVAPAYATCIDV